MQLRSLALSHVLLEAKQPFHRDVMAQECGGHSGHARHVHDAGAAAAAAAAAGAAAAVVDADAYADADASAVVQKAIDGREIVKTVIRTPKLINIVTKG